MNINKGEWTMPLDQETTKVLHALPFCFLLLKSDAEFTIVAASNDYLAATLTKREALLGQGLFSIFPDNPGDTQSNNVASLRESLSTVVQTKSSHAMGVTRYDVPYPNGDGFEIKYWLPTNLPVLNDDGYVDFIIHRVYDLTSLILASNKFSHADQLSDAAIMPLKDLLDYTADLQYVVELLREGERRREAAEAKAAEAGERFALAVNAAELGTFYCPMPLNKIYWNATCKAHFFLPPDAEIDFDLFYSLIHPDDRESTRMAIESSLARRVSYDVEYRVLAADGRTRWLRAKGRGYYGADGSPTRFDGITIDINRQKQAEEELRLVSRQKDEFLAMLAHELRNPLAPISAAASILVLPDLDGDRIRRTSAIIARQAKHMTGLINDLLDVSRVTRGMEALDKSAIDVRHTVYAAVEQVRPLLEARRHQLAVHLSPEAAFVLGDEKRLIQIIANLLINAAKFTSEAGKIELKMDVHDAHVMLVVRDNGIGMAPELVERVFDLFVQGERSPDRMQGGLGLGLALVKSLVELHAGSVAAYSPGIDLGSEFTVRLPLLPQSEFDRSPDFQNSQPSTPQRILKVMVVDDNVDAAKMLAMWLEAIGHDVTIENESSHALNRIRDEAPDVCLIDIGMPDMDGNELARRLRSRPQSSKLTLIAVTGYGQEQDKKTAFAAGFDHHFVKPVDINALSNLISSLVQPGFDKNSRNLN